MADKKCPNCGLWNSGSAILCDCGYDFEKGNVQYIERELIVGHEANPIESLIRWGTSIGYIVGITILFVGVSLGMAWWYIVTPEYDKSHELGFYAIGLYGSGFIILVSFVLIIWLSNKKIKALSYLLRASAILFPIVLSLFGCSGGWAAAYFIEGNDYPLGEMLIGVLIGFNIGFIIAVYLVLITLQLKTPPKETPALQNKNA
jgi:hypothetical protein